MMWEPVRDMTAIYFHNLIYTSYYYTFLYLFILNSLSFNV